MDEDGEGQEEDLLEGESDQEEDQHEGDQPDEEDNSEPMIISRTNQPGNQPGQVLSWLKGVREDLVE